MSGGAGRPRLDPDLLSGLAGAAFAPLASFGLGLPLWASLPGAVAVFLGLRMALAPRPDEAPVAPDRSREMDTAVDVIRTAEDDIARLGACVAGIGDATARERLGRVRNAAAGVVAQVRRRPAHLEAAGWLLTYHLPAAVRLGEGMLAIERAGGDRRRIDAAVIMVQRLNEAFVPQAGRTGFAAVDGLDDEIALLEGAVAPGGMAHMTDGRGGSR